MKPLVITQSRRRWIVSILLLSSLCVAQTGSGPTVKQVVDSFYPQTLVDLAARDGDDGIPLDRRSCFGVTEYQANGEPKTIIAGYSNNVDAQLRVLQAQAGGAFQVVYDLPDHLTGTDCAIQTVDLDGDDTLEAVVTFPSMGPNTVSYAFRWNGASLTNLAGTQVDERGGQRLAGFTNAQIVDLYHDGKKEIIEGGTYPPPREGAPAARHLYRFSGGQLVESGAVVDNEQFVRGKGTPTTDQVRFLLPGGISGPYRLRLTNGLSNGSGRVSSATIKLNGSVVVSPNQLNQQVEFLEVALDSLSASNTIEATLDGKPGSKLTLLITPAQ